MRTGLKEGNDVSPWRDGVVLFRPLWGGSADGYVNRLRRNIAPNPAISKASEPGSGAGVTGVTLKENPSMAGAGE